MGLVQGHRETAEAILVFGMHPEVELTRDIEGMKARVVGVESCCAYRTTLGHHAKAGLEYEVERGKVEDGLLLGETRKLVSHFTLQAGRCEQMDFMRALRARELGSRFDDLVAAEGMGDDAYASVA